MNRSSRASGPGALNGIGSRHVRINAALFDTLNLSHDSGAVDSKILFGNGLESEDASFRWDSKNVCHEGLYEGRVALVGDRL